MLTGKFFEGREKKEIADSRIKDPKKKQVYKSTCAHLPQMETTSKSKVGNKRQDS